MADFEPKDYWKLYLDKETKERVREIQDHLENNYDSRSEFLQIKLREEKALSLEERIKRKEQDLKKEKEELEQLKTVKEERETQDKLRDKRELLKEKQQKLKNARNGFTCREEVRNHFEEKFKQKIENGDIEGPLSDWESLIHDKVDSRMDEVVSEENVDELVEDVQRLQEQVKELNGGREDYFMDLQKVENSK